MKRPYVLVPTDARKHGPYFMTVIADVILFITFIYFIGKFAIPIIDNAIEHNKRLNIQYETLPSAVTGDLTEGKYILLGKEDSDLIISVRTFDIFYERSVKDILDDVKRIAYIEGDDGSYNLINFIVVDEGGGQERMTPRDISTTKREKINESVGLLQSLPKPNG